MATTKTAVRDFWNEQSCGEKLLLPGIDKTGYQNQLEERYRLEPFIPQFAGFTDAKNREVLEIGVGLGADHQSFGQAGAILHGVDLTERAIAHTQRRFDILGLKSTLQVADAENLPFEDDRFDVVYSWGVLHHTPDTPKAVDEVFRVLKPGGTARIMIYYKYSLIGAMLWMRYGLMRGRPFISLAELYSRYLESPGTKAYSFGEARDIFGRYVNVELKSVLTHGDLLSSGAGQRHQGICLTVARKLWPRWLLKRVFKNNGLFLLISARKPSSAAGQDAAARHDAQP